MYQIENLKSFRHFSRHLFMAGKAHAERAKAREEVDNHLRNMRKSIIRMSLRYTDVDRLKEKLDRLVEAERKYAQLFRPHDNETKNLKAQMEMLEQELSAEKAEKYKMMDENQKKISELNESLENVKNQMKSYLLERAKRHQHLIALEKKINEKVDVNGYYHK